MWGQPRVPVHMDLQTTLSGCNQRALAEWTRGFSFQLPARNQLAAGASKAPEGKGRQQGPATLTVSAPLHMFQVTGEISE